MAGVGQKFSLLDLERVCETAVGPGSSSLPLYGGPAASIILSIMLGSATSEL